MSFSKRNVPLQRTSQPSAWNARTPSASSPGVRPSPVTGHPTISTGCSSLDGLLAANAGLALGQSLLIEENGTTDYGSTLLRCYAAEGVLQGHHVYVVGMGEAWGRELPGAVEGVHERSAASRVPAAAAESDADKMRIAWRYERMGAHGERIVNKQTSSGSSRSSRDVTPAQIEPSSFCHSYDLTKRLTPPPSAKPIRYFRPSIDSNSSPFILVIQKLQETLSSAETNSVHRLVVPSLLSPAIFPPHSTLPQHVLTFLRSLRALLRIHSKQLSCMLTLPLSLYPRATGLTRCMERLADGVLELAPFPHSFDVARVPGVAGKEEERPQGMVKIHSLPTFTERGGGEGKGLSVGGGDDLCFVVSRRDFQMRAFDLPPLEGDEEAQSRRTANAKDMDF